MVTISRNRATISIYALADALTFLTPEDFDDRFFQQQSKEFGLPMNKEGSKQVAIELEKATRRKKDSARLVWDTKPRRAPNRLLKNSGFYAC